jgi:hypothetical protein
MKLRQSYYPFASRMRNYCSNRNERFQLRLYLRVDRHGSLGRLDGGTATQPPHHSDLSFLPLSDRWGSDAEIGAERADPQTLGGHDRR